MNKSKPKLSELLKQKESQVIALEKKEKKIIQEEKPKKVPIFPKHKDLHILTEENLIIFIKQTNETKKYEMKHRFYDATALEISNMVEKLLKEGRLKRNVQGWISLKENSILKM